MYGACAWEALARQEKLRLIPYICSGTALVIGKILNHSEPGVTRVYDRHSYDAEKRQALNAWERVMELVTTMDNKVLRLNRKP
jgi:hypothetical protein